MPLCVSCVTVGVARTADGREGEGELVVPGKGVDLVVGAPRKRGR